MKENPTNKTKPNQIKANKSFQVDAMCLCTWITMCSLLIYRAHNKYSMKCTNWGVRFKSHHNTRIKLTNWSINLLSFFPFEFVAARFCVYFWLFCIEFLFCPMSANHFVKIEGISVRSSTKQWCVWFIWKLWVFEINRMRLSFLYFAFGITFLNVSNFCTECI